MKWIAIILTVFLLACSTVVAPLNQPIASAPIDQSVLPSKVGDDETLLVLTFSGGGTRAAALSYGVLKALKDTSIGGGLSGKSLLSEVDVISSVSGGSFTAAYYGLFGDKIFSDYEKSFLKYPMQSKLLNDGLLSPKNWGVLSSDFFNRSDLAADFYDKQLFLGKKFADMRSDMPTIIINATDISAGRPFTFTKEHMQKICSNQADYLVSRAVVASSAVPAVFSPITLINYDGCNNAAKSVYTDKARYPYLHLLDGGISDNLGIRSVLSLADSKHNALYRLLANQPDKPIKQVVFIVVDAADKIPERITQSPKEPNLEDIIGAVTTFQSMRYNESTLKLLENKIAVWRRELQSRQCYRSAHRCRPIAFYLIELNLKQLPAPIADEMMSYETSLELPETQVDKLIGAGQYLLKNSPEYLRLLRRLQQ